MKSFSRLAEFKTGAELASGTVASERFWPAAYSRRRAGARRLASIPEFPGASRVPSAGSSISRYRKTKKQAFNGFSVG
jgi:hypothetical protein